MDRMGNAILGKKVSKTTHQCNGKTSGTICRICKAEGFEDGIESLHGYLISETFGALFWS